MIWNLSRRQHQELLELFWAQPSCTLLTPVKLSIRPRFALMSERNTSTFRSSTSLKSSVLSDLILVMLSNLIDWFPYSYLVDYFHMGVRDLLNNWISWFDFSQPCKIKIDLSIFLNLAPFMLNLLVYFCIWFIKKCF